MTRKAMKVDSSHANRARIERGAVNNKGNQPEC